MLGRINQIIDSSLVDGPGNRTAIFFQGCNFNCHYCHNPETISPGNPKQDMELSEVLERIKRNRPFIKGITVSGGECSLQYAFIEALFLETKKMGLSNFIDTNGSLPFWELPVLTELTDGFMLDVKATDVKSHLLLTGKDNKVVLKNAEFLASIGKLYEVRTVMVKDELNNQKTVEEVGDLLQEYLGQPIRYKLIPFRPHGVRTAYRHWESPSSEKMERLKDLALAKGFEQITVAS
jgi:pyruvate formate lyase activating enzyme